MRVYSRRSYEASNFCTRSYIILAGIVVARARSGMPDGKTSPSSDSASLPNSGRTAFEKKLANFGAATRPLRTDIAFRDALDEQSCSGKEARRGPGKGAPGAQVRSSLCIRLIFRALPTDIGMQVSSVIRTGPATRCFESFVTSRQSLTLDPPRKALVPRPAGGKKRDYSSRKQTFPTCAKREGSVA